VLRATTPSVEICDRSVGDVLADPVAEIFLLAVAAHVLEGKDADAQVAAPRPLAAGSLRRADENAKTVLELAPAGSFGRAVPARKVGALDLVEGERRDDSVERGLDQDPGGPRGIRLGPDPLRLGRLGRPQDHDRLGGLQAFLDDLGIGAVRGELVVAPHREALGAKRVGDAIGRRLFSACIGDEHVRHQGSPSTL